MFYLSELRGLATIFYFPMVTSFAGNSYRYQFLLDFPNFFSSFSAIATKYTYQISKSSVKQLWSYINHSRKMEWNGLQPTGMSFFWSFFSSFSAIATKYIYRLSKRSVERLRNYINYSKKMGWNGLQVWVFARFF